MYDHQHGFRERRSCETQFIMLIEDLARNASWGKQTDIIFLDFSKVYDKKPQQTFMETTPIRNSRTCAELDPSLPRE